MKTLFASSVSKFGFSFAMLLPAAMMPMHAHAGGASAATSQVSLQAPDDQAILTAVASRVAGEIQNLESLLSSRQYGQALERSKALLDDVRTKVGIHPKAAYREKIQVPAGSLKNGLPSPDVDFKRLRLDTQDTIALAVSNQRGGYFLDVLNLMKRVNLIYIKAFHQTLKAKSGKLVGRDVQKIVQDILDVHAVPLYIRDPELNDVYLIFDAEITNSDQSYLFNRELMDYVLNSGKELKITSADQFETLLLNHISGVRSAYLATLRPAQTNAAANNINNVFESPNFKACLSIYSVSYSSGDASDTCLRHLSYNFVSNPAFDSCMAIYQISDSKASAADTCRRKVPTN